TGALIRAAVLLGAACGRELRQNEKPRLDRYAKAVGLAFQVGDDVLDYDASTATLGKTAGKDPKQGKPTYVSSIGISAARRRRGHLSSSLGTVELTIALHYVFETPEDRIVWDVGHQTYPHKILTGRRGAMSRLRMIDGISGFPRRIESRYDTFGTAHSSTSISAALGMAVSSRIKNEKRHCIAVIGDGAMSAGMAYEAMNNAGAMNVDLLVILNDNEMS